MAKLIANTVVKKDYEYVVLYAGTEVPDWAADQVGDHLIAPEGYSALKVSELKAEVESRNADRDEAKIKPASDKKADLVAALEADDAGEPGKAE